MLNIEDHRNGSILGCSLEVTVLVLVWIASLNLRNELMDATVGDGNILRRSLEFVVLELVRIADLNLGNE